MAGTPEIRRAVQRDRERLSELWLDLIEHHRRLDPSYPPLVGIREMLERELERGLRSDLCRLLLAESGELPVGFVFAEIERSPEARGGARGRGGRIQELWVDPDWRRRGVATALIESAGDWFRKRDVSQVTIRVEPGNLDGLGFWQSSGFVERARILERLI